MFRRLLHSHSTSALLSLALLLSTLTGLHAQKTTPAFEAILQTNAQLTSEAKSSLPLSTQARNGLVTRHAALVQSFRDSPATARSLALDDTTRAVLLKQNPAYAALIEQEMSVTGQLTSAIEDSFKTHTSRKVYSLHTASRDTNVSFANAPAKLSTMEGHMVTVQGLGFPEIVVAESIRSASPAEAGSAAAPLATASPSNARAIRASATPSFTGPGITTAAPAAAIVTGPQSAVVIIVNFPNTPADTGGNPASSTPLTLQAPFNSQAYYNTMLNPGSIPNVSGYIAETSYGKASYAADVYGLFVLPAGYSCGQAGGLITAAIQAASDNGVDLTRYNRVVVPFPTTNCTYDGLASGPFTATNLINHEYSWVAFPIGPSETSDTAGFAQKFLVMSHEFGHNLGLGHSNTIDFGPVALGPIDFVATNPGTVDPGGPAHIEASAVTGSPITGINDEYGDPYPIMAGVGYTPYNAEHRYGLVGWIGADGEQNVTASGNFSVAPTENTSGLRALHILRDATSNSWIWVEFHQPSSVYTNFGIPLIAGGQALTTGAELLYSTGTLDSGHTYLIDTTPSAKPNNFADATLANGLSWSDAYSLLTITAGSQTSSALGVTISYDAPCATVSLSTPVAAAAGGSGNVSINAPAGCAWLVSSNASWISFPGITSGTGGGSFTVPYAYSANTAALQRNSYITAQRRSLPIVQQGSGTTVVSVTPAGIAVPPSTFVPIAFNLTNAAGASSITTFFPSIEKLNAALAVHACQFVVDASNPTAVNVFDYQTGIYQGTPGTAGTASIGSCTVDFGASSYTTNGNNAALTLSISFPMNFTGNHLIDVAVDGSTYLPFGYVNVATPTPVFSTTTALTVTPSSITTAQSTVLQATVAGNPAASLTGSVTFATGSTSLGSCTLSGTSCSINVAGSALQPGANSILATYGGGGSYPTSISNTATVTVTSSVATQTITFNALPSVTYGVSPITLAATASSGLPVSYSVTGNATVSGSVLTVTGTGPISVTASQAGNASYSAATPVTRSFTASPATLTVTAASFSRPYGAANPAFTYAVTGFVRNDSSVIVSGSATLSTTATATSPVASYPITFSAQGLTATNYTFAYVNENLQVMVAVQTITFGALPNVTYGVSPISLTGSASSGLPITYLVSGPATVSGSTLTVNGTGSITVTATQAGNGNYSAASAVAQTFTSNPPAAGSVTLTTQSTLQRLGDNSYRATVGVKNTGTGTAQNVQMNVAALGSASGTPTGGGTLPVSLGSLASGASITVTFNFPASAGTPGAGSSSKFTGTYTGGTFGGTSRVTLP